ncbi:orotate phosphoribosyltransferase [Streptomyces sp. NPDC096176]|uniref:orotate phosphoribosyltransferase n=1 Tax=Streptomyces sp. NPDC096176 TaxID=3366079 RepID=UPI0037F85873
MTSAGLLARIRETAFRQGEFHLPSGQVVHEYFDEFLLAADPALLGDVARALAPAIPPGTEVLIGLELGGVPLTVALSAASGIPAAFLRRRPKAYGTFKQVEGQAVAGRNVVVVDDVVRSGGQALEAAAVLRRLGATVGGTVCVLDRGLEGRARLAAEHIELRSLLLARDAGFQEVSLAVV